MSIANAAITTPSSEIERKIQNAIEGLPFEYFKCLSERILPGCIENAQTICDYISALKSEINPSDCYRKSTITLLCRFSIFFKNAKLFKQITREDILLSLIVFAELRLQTHCINGSEHITFVVCN